MASAFTPAGELAKARGVRVQRVEETCAMCDGRELAMPIGSACLEATIETMVEKMAEQGKLDRYLEKVLERRLRYGSVNEPRHLCDDIIDETPAPYSGVD